MTITPSPTPFAVLLDGVRYEFRPAEEGGYVVNVPAARGCWSEGDTFEEALDNIQDALREWLVVAKEKSFKLTPNCRPLSPAISWGEGLEERGGLSGLLSAYG